MTQEIPPMNGMDGATQDLPWTRVRIWKISAVLGLATSILLALSAGKEMIPGGILTFAVALIVLEKVAKRANAAVVEQVVASADAEAEECRMKCAALEQAASEQAAREAAVAREAAAAQEVERVQSAAAEQAADQILFEDLVQEAHKRLGYGITHGAGEHTAR
ncbi:hypothetical protein [Rhodococcus sp. W8901]|uniref:hypothetical protein n=1 Tax=Rhodococcus sp. W8901 TaxID=2742603 RepID=UPI0015826526|nr:hypothetical protein [Rhodococcus sp. W8901]QKT12160.1 hypothetical protein HUN07_16895 [Rhodococcus sp. W8901]